MQSFVIGACSTCDLPQDYVDRHEIAIVKYTFTINHKEYKDGDMDAHTFLIWSAKAMWQPPRK